MEKNDINKKIESFRQVHASRIPSFTNSRQSAKNRKIPLCGVLRKVIPPAPEANGNTDIRQSASNAEHPNCSIRK